MPCRLAMCHCLTRLRRRCTTQSRSAILPTSTTAPPRPAAHLPDGLQRQLHKQRLGAPRQLAADAHDALGLGLEGVVAPQRALQRCGLAPHLGSIHLCTRGRAAWDRALDQRRPGSSSRLAGGWEQPGQQGMKQTPRACRPVPSCALRPCHHAAATMRMHKVQQGGSCSAGAGAAAHLQTGRCGRPSRRRRSQRRRSRARARTPAPPPPPPRPRPHRRRCPARPRHACRHGRARLGVRLSIEQTAPIRLPRKNCTAGRRARLQKQRIPLPAGLQHVQARTQQRRPTSGRHHPPWPPRKPAPRLPLQKESSQPTAHADVSQAGKQALLSWPARGAGLAGIFRARPRWIPR